jgi:hypothetical protein
VAAVTLAMLGTVGSAHASSSTTPSSSSSPSSSTPSSTPTSSTTAARPTPSSTSSTPSTPAAPTGSSTTPAKAPPGSAGEERLSPAELAAQIAQANALTDQLTASNAAIAAAATRLDRLSAEANALLQAYATAKEAEQAAQAEAERNVMLFGLLSDQAGKDRQTLGQWAYQAYAGSGGSLGDVGALLDLLGRSADAVSDTAAQLSYLSDQRNLAFERVRDQAQLQRDVATRAVEAAAVARDQAAKAADAKHKLDAVVAQQRAQLDATRALHAAQVAKAGPVNGLLLGSGDPAAIQASRTLRAAMLVPGVSANGSVKPCSNNEQQYPNGQIPVSGLCPLLGNPTQMLRPSAAAAFNALSVAYERDTGQPICVTDSYRSFAEQVAVKASRGMWAATPGTSQHGLGLAVDLCGGIEDFGSPAHLWMKQNAPLYGWFHPDWAEPTGALPEPWHWEYAG